MEEISKVDGINLMKNIETIVKQFEDAELQRQKEKELRKLKRNKRKESRKINRNQSVKSS